ncbi:unnamed protein product [Paramecium primaurelia]|uniref:Uncharacterized protein n=1 Tax=Paramecium primaurelia TaxID=5886 RepID=A0A8S1JSK2_PARPR|nr:unnamed protein product [Paramecium primaurelia]
MTQQDGDYNLFMQHQDIVLNFVNCMRYKDKLFFLITSFKFKICQSGYFKYKDNSYISRCDQPYQKLNGSYCQDFDDETPCIILFCLYLDSNYLTYDFLNNTVDPQYGSIYYEFIILLKWDEFYQRLRYIQYQLLFKLNQNPEYIFFIFQQSKINHDLNTITISWECFGPNNEQFQAYFGFHNYQIFIHKCQPYQLQCSDQSTCTQWNSDYDANVVKFSQEEFLSNQYNDKDSVRCLDCPISCLTCTSKIDFQICQSTFKQTKLGQICKFNIFEDSNQLFDYPIDQLYKLFNQNNRQLKNQQCICIDGYYPILQNPKCEKCHYFCSTCTEPTFNDYLIFNNIVNIENMGSTCIIKNSLNHASSVINHAKLVIEQIDGCLICDINLNRILKDKNVNVNLLIMNQIVFVQKMCYQVHVIYYVLINNNYDIQLLVFLVILDFFKYLENVKFVDIYKQLNMNNGKIIITQWIIYVIIVSFNIQLFVKLVMNQLLYLVLIFVEMKQLLEQKNAKMETILNMIYVLIANINANPNVQNILKESVLKVQLMDGKLIQQFNRGNVKKNVGIYKQQDKNNVELDVHLVIMTQKLVQTVYYLNLFQQNIIVKLSAEICWLQQILMDFTWKKVMMGIQLFMINVLRIVNFNAKYYIFELVVYIIDVKLVLLDIIYLDKYMYTNLWRLIGSSW